MTKEPTYALYIEMQKYKQGSQMILTPPTFNSLTGELNDVVMLSRKITANHPRRSWQIYKARVSSYEPSTAPVAAGQAIQETAPVLRNINDLLLGFASGGWKITKQPITIEMTYDDICDVLDNKTPAALIRRINRARDEAGFPKTVWPVEEEPVTPGVGSFVGWTAVPQASESVSETPNTDLTSELRRILDDLDELERKGIMNSDSVRWETPTEL